MNKHVFFFIILLASIFSTVAFSQDVLTGLQFCRKVEGGWPNPSSMDECVSFSESAKGEMLIHLPSRGGAVGETLRYRLDLNVHQGQVSFLVFIQDSGEFNLRYVFRLEASDEAGNSEFTRMVLVPFSDGNEENSEGRYLYQSGLSFQATNSEALPSARLNFKNGLLEEINLPGRPSGGVKIQLQPNVRARGWAVMVLHEQLRSLTEEYTLTFQMVDGQYRYAPISYFSRGTDVVEFERIVDRSRENSLTCKETILNKKSNQ